MEKILNKLKLSILDKYILKQVLEIFLMGIIIFTSIIFASDTFTTLIKQITDFGMPVHSAFMLVILNLPSIIVMTIPISVLFATIMTINRMCLASEISVLRACGVSIVKIAKPIFGFAILAVLISFIINEAVVPETTLQSRYLAMWSITQRHIPNGKKNFTLKELQHGNKLKRFFYVEDCSDNQLKNVSILDMSDPDLLQIIQANEGNSTSDGWVFNNASTYSITPKGKSLSTVWLEQTVVDFGADVSDSYFALPNPKNYSFMQIMKILKDGRVSDNSDYLDTNQFRQFAIEAYNKSAFPITSLVLVLLGVPLAITPPRVRYNRGFLFSILIIFFYYIIRAFSISIGEAGNLHPFLAAWLPNIVIGIAGLLLFYKKAMKI